MQLTSISYFGTLVKSASELVEYSQNLERFMERAPGEERDEPRLPPSIPEITTQ